MKKGKFTQDEIDCILKLYQEEHSFKEIAQELNRDARSISNKLRNLGIYKPSYSLRQWSQNEINTAIRLFESGMNFTQIGNEIGRDQRSVSLKLKEIGYHKPKSKRNISLWDVKDLRKYIIDIEEAKLVTYKSHNKIKVKCDTCDKEKLIAPSKLVEYGISCPICSKGVSYPELFFMSYIETKNLKFVPEQVLDKSKGHRFDFVNYKERIIVETHGIQHYENKKIMDYERTIKSDEDKRKWCKNNGWILIELDCRVSSFEYIENNISKESLLEDITKEDSVKMLNLIEKNMKYPVKDIVALYNEGKSAVQIAKKYNVGYGTILRILRRMDITIRKGNPNHWK